MATETAGTEAQSGASARWFGPARGLDYKNVEHLQRFLGPQGQIVGRRRSGLSTKDQRELKRAIRHARHLGLLPFVG